MIPPDAATTQQPDAPPSQHRIWKLGADIDTDALAPGAWMTLETPELAVHCLEHVRPEFAASVRCGDMIAAGANFGIGSSREQAAGVLVELGVRAVIAPSFGGLFFRNAFNLGLLLLTTPIAAALDDGEVITFAMTDLSIGRTDGRWYPCEPIPGFLLEMVRAGGLINQLANRPGRSA